MNLKRTSSAAQNLYEGVNVAGEGKIALITYIRTAHSTAPIPTVPTSPSMVLPRPMPPTATDWKLSTAA